MRNIDKIVMLIGTIVLGSGCAGKYVNTGASVVFPTKYDVKSYASVEASSGGQVGPIRIGGGIGHSQQENDGLNVRTLRYFAELMYVAQNNLYAGVRHNEYHDELSGVIEAKETVNETDAVVGFAKGKGYVETSVGLTTIRVSSGFNF